MRSKTFSWRNPKSTGQVNPVPRPVNQDEPAQRIEKRYTDLLYVGPRTEDGVQLFHESVSAYNLKWDKLRRWLIDEFGHDERVHFETRNVSCPACSHRLVTLLSDALVCSWACKTDFTSTSRDSLLM